MTTYVEEIQDPYTGELVHLEAADEEELALLVVGEFERAAARHDGDWPA